MIADATKLQNLASRPESSAWVSANAGSGKTRVLTDRVARLLLAGNQPQKILCLTYTKAAAAEMQNRLFKRLGEWAMMDDASLRAALTMVGENGDQYGVEALRQTRTHFARALETPGGLKIQTIHAFCAGLLRRFPVEAGISPQFREMEEGQTALLRASILDDMARADDPKAFDALARNLTNEDGLDRLLLDVLKNRDLFNQFDRHVLAAKLGVAADATASDIQTAAMTALKEDISQALISYLASSTVGKEKTAGHALDIAVKAEAAQALNALEDGFLTKKKTPLASGLPSANTKKNQSDFAQALEHIKETVFEARQKVLAIRALNRAHDLHLFAKPFIQNYEAAKSAQSLLDFDDLIYRTRNLLSTQDMTQWVLYRLDNGIDHILVDEAQDTSPIQWDIIQHLSEEFTAGQSASPTNRTLFVVGDKKQSIFGFQGADPDEFHAKKDEFGARFSNASKKLDTIELPTSFRSAKPILELVDQAFRDDQGALGGPPVHLALDETPGRVDLWPFEKPSGEKNNHPWWSPVDTIPDENPVHVLASKIARYVKDLIVTKTSLPTKDGSRPIQPGDFLILVRSRTRFFHILIDQLKKNDVPVAGADRMKIGEQLAVRDLLSLLRFLDNELDDLSLAEALRSPIFGLTEGELFECAHGRKGSLWDALRKSRHTSAIEMLGDLRKNADFIRPYELLSRILTFHGARERMTARLGMECQDAIDELLSQTIAFEAVQAPTLGGFLHWLSVRDIEIKRDMDAGRNEVRVMTVHGAKGLEAPVVMLPDTTVLSPGNKKPPIGEVDGQAFWSQTKENEPLALQEIDKARAERDKYEYARLLYVALTRAENWLIVAGAGQEHSDQHRWYTRVANAMTALDATQNGDVLSLTHNWQGDHIETPKTETTSPTHPNWMREKPKAHPKPMEPISPSKFAGPHALPGDHDDNGTKRGDLIHRLLEVLPTQPEQEWADLTAQLCTPDFDPTDILQEVAGVIKNPDLASLFDQQALVEVAITAQLDERDGQVMSGRIDRLVISPDQILAVDFKSNRVIPPDVAKVPKAILAQQGAYAAALLKIYPQHQIKTAIVWTRTSQLMALPHDDVIEALRSATTS